MIVLRSCTPSLAVQKLQKKMDIIMKKLDEVHNKMEVTLRAIQNNKDVN